MDENDDWTVGKLFSQNTHLTTEKWAEWVYDLDVLLDEAEAKKGAAYEEIDRLTALVEALQEEKELGYQMVKVVAEENMKLKDHIEILLEENAILEARVEYLTTLGDALNADVKRLEQHADDCECE